LSSWVQQTFRAPASAVESVAGPDHRGFTRERLVLLFLVAAIAALIVMACAGPVGWDAQITWRALRSVRQGLDPYAAGIAEQRSFQHLSASRQAEHVPFAGGRQFYDYPPLTILAMRLLAGLPDWLLVFPYWIGVAAGFFLQVWAAFQLADESERRWLALLLPAVAFFPGLITDDVILSGNISYIFYGLILAAAVSGWQRDRWFWFYLAVLAASIVKPPCLTLLAFPILAGRRQWVPSAATAGTGLAAIAAQAWLWPELFREHLTALRILFDLGADFGYGPIGVIARALWNRGWTYSPATTVLYVALVAAFGCILLSVGHQVRQGRLSRQTWIPVALVGTFLLNPRIMKYDMAAITIPMLLIASRGLRAILHTGANDYPDAGPSSHRSLVLIGAGCFLVPNLMTVFAPAWWPVELLVLLATFGLGVRSLVQPQVEVESLGVPADLVTLATGEVV
jgi:hypothetical protein